MLLHRGMLGGDTLHSDILHIDALRVGVSLGNTLLRVVAPYAYCAEHCSH